MDFGYAFVLNQLLEQTGLATGLTAQPQSDSLKALLCFYVLGSARLEAAPDWLSASYAQVLYLKAHLDHAVKLLTALGSEPSCSCLSRWMAAQPHEAVVAIESAGLPQSVQFPVSAVNGPQDAYSEALRLVFMVDQVTDAPLALSCGAEGELSALLAALPPNWVVLDRPYVTAADWQYLHAQGRDFVTHLERTNPTAQELIAQHLATLQDAQYLEQYGEQIIFIKRVAVPLRDAHGEVICSGWAYLCCELEQRQRAERALFLALARGELTKGDFIAQLETAGVVVLFATQPVAPRELWMLYELRLCNRALFALKPSDTIAAPLVERSAASVRGHLLMTLMAEVLRFALKAQLSSTSYHPQQALLLLRAQKIKLNAGVGMVTEASAPVTAFYQALGIEYPTHITLSASATHPIRDRESLRACHEPRALLGCVLGLRLRQQVRDGVVVALLTARVKRNRVLCLQLERIRGGLGDRA